MALAIFNAIAINLSRILEALFDELEYRLAKSELRQSAKAKFKSRTRSKVLNEGVIATSAKAISVRAT